MITTTAVTLHPDPRQQTVLEETLRTANAVCNVISMCAWEAQLFDYNPIHQATYKLTRHHFKFAAQMAILSISRVVRAYQVDATRQQTFNRYAPTYYDTKLLSWDLQQQKVSIWTLEGRQHIPYRCGDTEQDLLAFRQGLTELVYCAGTFYLLTTCEIPDPTPRQVQAALGLSMIIDNSMESEVGMI